MSCNDTRELLLDLGLTAEARRQVAAAMTHIAACNACQASLKDFDLIAAALQAAGTLPAKDIADTDDHVQRSADLLRFETAVNADRVVPRVDVQTRRMRIGFRALAGMAAAFVLAAGSYLVGSHIGHGSHSATGGTSIVEGSKSFTSPAETESLAMRPPDRNEIIRRLKEFDKVDQFYDGRTRWLLLSLRDSDIGLDDSVQPKAQTTSLPSPLAASQPASRVVMLRLKLVRGDDVVSDADLLIVPGNEAQIVVSTTGGSQLRYRVSTSATVPGQLMLRAELRADSSDEAQAALATRLQLVPDRTTSAGRLVTPGGAYNVAVSYATPM